jgi:shikimate dehydrogenase
MIRRLRAWLSREKQKLSEGTVPAGKHALLGLIGAPIKHSASPAMHEAAGRDLGIHCFYQLIEIAGADRAELNLLMQGLRRFGFAGVNVTFPYKEAIIEHLDDLAPGAKAVGAVNTVILCDGHLIGHNTDASGFERAIRPLVEASNRGPVALIGAGGVGKAIAFAIARLQVADIRVYDVDPAKVAAIKALASPIARVTACASVEETLKGAVGLINATPVGMSPNYGMPVPAELLRPDLWVADAVYSPLWTGLLLAAAACGAKVMTGRELAIYQAADAFELFTGFAPSVEVMGRAFDSIINARDKAAQAA